MPSLHETIYPRFKSSISEKELHDIYTPSADEFDLSRKAARGGNAQTCFLIMLKCFQRLGYFMPLSNIPQPIRQHISSAANIPIADEAIEKYNKSGSRLRHAQLIREHLQVKPYGPVAIHVMKEAIEAAAKTKDEPSDLINIAIEELIRHRFELPAFSTLARASNNIRVSIYRSFYKQIYNRLSADSTHKLDKLFELEEDTHYSPWNASKQDPGRPTLMHLKDLAKHLKWLSQQNVEIDVFVDIPYIKIRHLAAEAKTLNAAQMKALEMNKRYSLAAALIKVELSVALDDLAEMLIKRMSAIHKKGKEALELYHIQQVQSTDKFIATLKDVIVAYNKDGGVEERFSAIQSLIGNQSENILSECENHAAHAGNNYYPFLWKYYKSHRIALFGILKTIALHSTSQDISLENSLKFLQAHENTRKEFIEAVSFENKGKDNELKTQLLDLSWVSDIWWKLMTGHSNRSVYPDKINRRHFEICVFSQITWDLKSGDLYVEGSDKFSDYREQLIPWDEYERLKEEYGIQAGLTVNSHGFAEHMKTWLNQAILDTDNSFVCNQYLRFEKG